MILGIIRAYNLTKQAILETVAPNGPEFTIGYRDGFPAAGDVPTSDVDHKNSSYKRGLKSGKQDRERLQSRLPYLFENGILREDSGEE